MLHIVTEILEQFQTGIVGVVGFVGVISTIYYNGKLAREQHARLLRHERMSLRTALCAELEVIRDTYVERSKTLTAVEDQQPSLLPEVSQATIYQQLLEKVGLLTSQEVTSLIKAYALINELPVRVRLLEAQDFGGNHVRSGYIEVSGVHAKSVATMHDNFVKVIDETLATVRSAMNAESPA
jgi:hypothetical protein